MFRTLTIALVVTGLAGLLGACSDDDKPKPDTVAQMDAGVDAMGDSSVDAPATEAGADAEPAEAGADAGVDGSSAPVKVLAGVIEYTGKSGTGPDAGTITLVRTLASVEKDDPVIKPDFGSKAVGSCYAYTWTDTTPPNKSAWDSGKISITGHQSVPYIDGDNPGTPQNLPDPIECTRKQVSGSTTLWEYDCGLPAKPVLTSGSMFTSSTTMDISATGGADLAAWSQTGVTVGGVPTVATDLTAIDPSQKTEIEWTAAPNALVISIVMRGELQDGSKTTEIACSVITFGPGKKEIPAGALALLPTPTASNPLIIQTVVAGLGVKLAGDITVGAGQGVFGTTCRIPSGLCP